MARDSLCRLLPVLAALVLLAATGGPGYEVVGEFESPFTGRVYEVRLDRTTGGKQVFGPQGERFDGIREVYDAELRALGDPKARLAPSLWPAVDAESVRPVTLLLVLSEQPLSDIAGATRGMIGRAGADRVRAWRREVLRRTALAAAASRAPVLKRLDDEEVVGTTDLLNAIEIVAAPADLPDLLRANPEIWCVLPAGEREVLLDKSVPTVGAKAFWDGGYDGTGVTVGVIDTGMDDQHPALKSAISEEKVFLSWGKSQSNFNDDATSTDDKHGHGTHCGGIVASRDTTYTGVAKGASLVNAKAFYLTTSGLGSGHDYDIIDATHWAVSRVDVFSLSFGGTGGNGDSALARLYDAAVQALSIPTAVAAGNSGPSAKTVLSPGDAFNVVTVGSLYDKGTSGTSDDALSSFSSRGPTTDGRRKPTLTAPGQLIYSASNGWESGSDFRNMSGTSMACPHMAGALALLLDYGGTWKPESLKALLANSARTGSPYPTAPDDDWGYGGLDLGAAYDGRANVKEGTLTSTGPESVYYLGTSSLSSGDRATLVWNRHVTFPSSGTPGTPPALLDLDLHLYDGTTGAEKAKSASGVDPVEQVKASGTVATPVLRVKRTGSFPTGSGGFTTESFALAAPAGFTAADPADFDLAVTAPSDPLGPGVTFSVTVTVKNTGDLPALAPELTVTLPSGFSFVAGSSTTTLSNISGGGSARIAFTLQSPTASTTGFITATVVSTAFDVTSSGGPASAGVTVDSIAPEGTLEIDGGNAYTNDTDVTLTLSATDADSGVADMQLAAGDDAFGTWESYTTSRSFSLPAGDGEKTVRARFRDRAGNVSATATDTIRLDTAAPAGSVTLDGGADYTNAPFATASLAATDSDSGVADMRFRVDGGTFSTWETFAATRDIPLPGPDGERLVEFSYRDVAGNASDPVGDRITVDRTPPAVTVEIEGGAKAVNFHRVALTLTASDNLSGVVEMSLDGGGWLPFAEEVSHDLPEGEGVRSVEVRVRDRAGNVSAAATDEILVDTTAPTGSLAVNAGRPYVLPEEPIVFTVAAKDAGSGVADGGFSFDGGGTWTAPYPLAAGTVILATGDRPAASGLLVAMLRIRDRAGNVSEPVSAPFFFVTGNPPRAARKQTGRLEDGTEVDALALDLVKGDRLTVKLKAKADVKKGLIDVTLDLARPDGRVLVTDRFPGTLRTSGIRKFPAPETGRYLLLFRRTAGLPGSWSAKVKVAPAKESKRPKGEGASIRFDAVSGSILKGSLKAAGLRAADVRIFGPTGEVPFFFREGKGKITIRPTTLDAGTGTYEIAVPQGVVYRLSVARPRSD